MTVQEPTLEPAGPILDRGETGRRILVTLVSYLAFRVASAVLAVVVVFELLWALITQETPNPRVRNFANRTLSYLYEISRYASYNSDHSPFPFSEFPAALEAVPSADELFPDYGDEVRESEDDEGEDDA